MVVAILLWLPNDRYGRRAGHGAAMSYPSLATPPTGASVLAATAPRRTQRLKWNDERIKNWIIAGVAAGSYRGVAQLDSRASLPKFPSNSYRQRYWNRP